ncbi:MULTISPECIES: hypothetical protein [Arthrobacter]|uniref:hypothetical protein n=1 Tax=Arthrobacter TaxID=1663 RepID=UPI0011A9454F|nr:MULTISPECIES: hypothetical protein [Arthrobacter]
MEDALTPVEREVILNGEDDWVLFANIMGIINEAEGMSNTVEQAVVKARELSLSLCARSLARLGRYVEGQGFVPWAERGDALRGRLDHELTHPPEGHDEIANQMTIMLEVLPAGFAARSAAN